MSSWIRRKTPGAECTGKNGSEGTEPRNQLIIGGVQRTSEGFQGQASNLD